MSLLKATTRRKVDLEGRDGIRSTTLWVRCVHVGKSLVHVLKLCYASAMPLLSPVPCGLLLQLTSILLV